MFIFIYIYGHVNLLICSYIFQIYLSIYIFIITIIVWVTRWYHLFSLSNPRSYHYLALFRFVVHLRQSSTLYPSTLVIVSVNSFLVSGGPPPQGCAKSRASCRIRVRCLSDTVFWPNGNAFAGDLSHALYAFYKYIANGSRLLLGRLGPYNFSNPGSNRHLADVRLNARTSSLYPTTLVIVSVKPLLASDGPFPQGCAK